ncbi:hypothetical protein H2199_007445 [Coniosporium tulheliwenetii]|uniref:Uncharacterized protein n=1 Tax=Coniosporium tulheliwenetii TaxID=3383036 RepID=A0ACC2YPF6_9PEZI|nr:hypothetical protein H2199_007445 [Cladosporium sp. JES 115]
MEAPEPIPLSTDEESDHHVELEGLFERKQLDSASQDIRLLSLLPGHWEDDIRCSVRVVSLKDNPAYETLSYVWGDPTVTKPIFVDGGETQITTNLEDALRHLRDPDNALTVWIDALCINQASDEEKQHQVGMMREIYRNYARVYRATYEPFKGMGTTQADWDYRLGPLYSQWLQLAQLPKKYQCEDSTTTSRQRAFWRTITGDPSFTSTPFLETKLDRATRVDMKAYETWLAMVHATAGPVASDEVERLELTATYGRSFFVTKDDHMGLCYPTAQAGDEVWVLYGGRLPFILRPRNEEPDSSGARYYTFIGDCYLDGFMDGRAVDNPLYDERTVTLR